MNKVLLIGRLTAKPELRYTGSNIPYARFTLAVNRSFNRDSNNGPTADFIGIIAWRKQAENICNYLDKGSQVSVEGRIQTGSYDKDGQRVYTTDIVADTVQFLERKSSRSGQDNSSPYDYQPEPVYNGPSTPEVDINQDDPFADFGDSVSIDDNFLE